MNNQYTFCIADFLIVFSFVNTPYSLELIPSCRPFITHDKPKDGQKPLLKITVDDTTQPVSPQLRHRIRTFDTGNGDTVVDKIATGGYQYIIKDIDGHECALLITNEDFSDCHCALNGNFIMRRFGFNNALMLAFSFASCNKSTLLIHASLVRHNGYGYAFIAKSGTGKSTQVSNWLKYIPNCDLMNDDNPIVRVIDGKPYIYGSPWSGKTPCYRNVKAPLGAITRIDRAKANSVEKLQPIQAFASLLSSCSSMKWDTTIYNKICDTVTQVVEHSNIYILHCLPDRESAIVCHSVIAKK